MHQYQIKIMCKEKLFHKSVSYTTNDGIDCSCEIEDIFDENCILILVNKKLHFKVNVEFIIKSEKEINKLAKKKLIVNLIYGKQIII